MSDDAPAQAAIARGRFSDGVTAAVVAVDLALAPDALLIEAADGRSWRWPLSAIRRVPDEGAGNGLRLTVSTQQDSRLTIEDAASLLPRLRALCPDLDALAGLTRSGRIKLAAGIATALAFLVLAYFGLPALAGRLAPVLPLAWQQGIGARTETDLAVALSRAGICDAAAGDAAVSDLVARLAAAAGVAAPHVTVLDAALINAFALPGNRLVLTRGMIGLTENGDELAGIVAHELAHLRHGDPLVSLLARLEWNALTSLVFGNTTLAGFGETIVLLSYSRDVEARADAEGLATLRAAGIDSAGFAAIMRRLGQSEPGAFSYLRSHPATTDRVAAIERQGSAGGSALDGASWAEIKRICGIVRPFSVS